MWNAIYLYGIGSTRSASYLCADTHKNGELSVWLSPPGVIQGAEASRNHPTNKRKRYENIQRSSDCIFTQLTLNEGRAVE